MDYKASAFTFFYIQLFPVITISIYASVEIMMKFLFIGLALLIAPISIAKGCGVKSDLDYIADRESDLQEEIRLVRELSTSSEKVLIANVEWMDEDKRNASFELVKIIKGESEGYFNANWEEQLIVVSCQNSRMFHQVHLEKDAMFLLYLSANTISRAVHYHNESSGINFIHELMVLSEHMKAIK